MKHNRKMVYLLVLLSIILCTAMYMNVSSKAKAEEIRATQLEKNDSIIKSYQKKLIDFYKDKSYEELKDKVNLVDATLLLTNLKKMDNESLSQRSKKQLGKLISECEMTMKMINIQEGISNLFDDKGVLVEKAPIDKLEKQLAELDEIKGVFVKKQTQKLFGAKQQKQSIEVATKAVDNLFDANTVRKDVSRVMYEQSQILIQKVKNKEIQMMLLTRMKKVNRWLGEQEALVSEENEREAETTNFNATEQKNTTFSEGNELNNASISEQAEDSNTTKKTRPAQSNSVTSDKQTQPAESKESNTNKVPTQSTPSENNTSKPSKPTTGNSWTGTQTGSGTITAGGGSGGTGANTWTGGEFDPGDLDW